MSFIRINDLNTMNTFSLVLCSYPPPVLEYPLSGKVAAHPGEEDGQTG